MCQENDIILCDGNCRRAYHEKCLEPPQDITSLPEDEGWLCPACDAKASPSVPGYRPSPISLCTHSYHVQALAGMTPSMQGHAEEAQCSGDDGHSLWWTRTADLMGLHACRQRFSPC